MIQQLVHKQTQIDGFITTDQLDLAARGAYELYSNAAKRYKKAAMRLINKETAVRRRNAKNEARCVLMYAEQLSSILSECYDIVEFQQYVTPDNNILFYAHYKFEDHEYLVPVKTEFVYAHKNIPINRVNDIKPLYPEAVNICGWSFINRTLRIIESRRRENKDYIIINNGTYNLTDPNYIPDYPVIPKDLLDARERDVNVYVINNVLIHQIII